jgi:DNA-binding GntR family transcriptional regulator
MGARASHYQNLTDLPQGKSRDIYIELQKAILSHGLLPGVKLSEDEVGELFGASRTIVRTALQALAHSQLVTIEKNRGAFIAQPSVKEAQEVFEARELIEPRVAGMAAKIITPKDIEILQNHIKAEHDAIAAGDKGEALSLSGFFHVIIADIAEHDVFSKIVRSLISRSSLIIALYWKRLDTTCESHSHHALLDAFAENDVQAAEKIMKSHIVDLHSGLDLKSRSQSKQSLASILNK